MTMMKQRILRKTVGMLPDSFGQKLKKLYYGRKHWAHPSLKKFGTVQDLYYWVANGSLDTVLPIQNYFSAFYPELDTATQGTVSLFDNDGKSIGTHTFTLRHNGGVKLRVSDLVKEIEGPPQHQYGTLEVNIDIPKKVLSDIQPQKSFYFWDRFYIGYTKDPGQISFVHGVDKTSIYEQGSTNATPWYPKSENRGWSPETPVDIDHYSRYTVIMINRSTARSDVALTLADYEDNSLTWNASIGPSGVHKFELTPDMLASLGRTELRMRVEGMASDYGRPMVFKEFPNGAISAMHC